MDSYTPEAGKKYTDLMAKLMSKKFPTMRPKTVGMGVVVPKFIGMNRKVVC